MSAASPIDGACCASGAPIGRSRRRRSSRGAMCRRPSTMRGAAQARSGRLLAHISTADTVRDLDYLRSLVGDRRLNYRGESYGTFLGQTYANMFPRRVGRMVLDSLIDPVPFTRSVEAGIASNSADAGLVFKKFLSLCQQAGPAQVRARGARPRGAAGAGAAGAVATRADPCTVGTVAPAVLRRHTARAVAIGSAPRRPGRSSRPSSTRPRAATARHWRTPSASKSP